VHWVPIIAWGVAVLVTVVVLGFCAYEILWKTKRLRGDVRQLQAVADQLLELRGDLVRAQERIAASGLR
jgi:hypothetical protein